jgi:hypothetical protein
MNGLEALIGLFLLAGTAGPTMTTPDSGPIMENHPDAVIIRASSRGCTKNRHFRLVSDGNNGYRVIRLRPDRCRQAPHRVEFRYSHAQLGIEPPQNLAGTRIAGN